MNDFPVKGWNPPSGNIADTSTGAATANAARAAPALVRAAASYASAARARKSPATGLASEHSTASTPAHASLRC